MLILAQSRAYEQAQRAASSTITDGYRSILYRSKF